MTRAKAIKVNQTGAGDGVEEIDLLPHSLEAERALLGSILIAPHLRDEAGMLLAPADFHDQGHREIYHAMLSIHTDRVPDFVGVVDQLEKTDRTDRTRGVGYITELISDCPSHLHWRHYAGIVKEHAQRRRLIAAAAEISKLAHRGDPAQVLALAEKRIAAVRDRQPAPEVQGSTMADLDDILGPIRWDWPGWLPAGFLTMIVGEEGMGKSMLALRIAACFLRGDPWPDGSEYTGVLGDVLWCEAEASQAVNRDRVKSWGLPLGNVKYPLPNPLDDVRLDNPDHRHAIAAIAQQPSVRMIAIDSLSGAHRRNEKDKETAEITKWLAELARNLDKPTLLTHHLRKRGLIDLSDRVTLDRVRGFSGITQTARMVWAIDAPDPTDQDDKRLSVIKASIAGRSTPLGFSISGAGLSFGEAPQPPRAETQTGRAIELLTTLLDRGPVASSVIETEARGAAISWETMKRAKKKLGIVAKREDNRWYWALPARKGVR